MSNALTEPAVETAVVAPSAPRSRPGSRSRQQRFPVTFWVLVVIATALTLPMVWLALTALKPEAEVSAQPIVWLPTTLELSNVVEALTRIDFGRYLGASLFLSTMSGVLTTLTSAACGFAFARFSTRLQRPLFGLLIALMMTPAIITLIPSYLLFARVGMVGTYWPWVLWALSGSPYLIFLFRQMFASMPRELEEAAILDGAGYLRIFARIFLPLSMPILVTSFVITFNYVWSDYIAPSLFLNDSNTTLAVAVAGGYRNAQGFPLRNLVSAGAILYVLPMIAVFLFGQRWYVQGMSNSGIK